MAERSIAATELRLSTIDENGLSATQKEWREVNALADNRVRWKLFVVDL